MNFKTSQILSVTKEALGKGRIARLAPIGGSMYPFIRSGEAVLIDRASGRGLRYGDIVLYCNNEGKVFIHRIVGVLRSGGDVRFIVKGDAAARPDNVVRDHEVLGRVVAVEKGNRTVNIDKGALRALSVAYSLLIPVSRWAYALYYRCVKKTG